MTSPYTGPTITHQAVVYGIGGASTHYSKWTDGTITRACYVTTADEKGFRSFRMEYHEDVSIEPPELNWVCTVDTEPMPQEHQ